MPPRKFVDLDEAAKMLGVTSDTLSEMRERRAVHGYRDGGNWKFKAEDIEKLAAERAAAQAEGDFVEMDEDPDSILLSEVELGASGESTSSTIIGGRSSRKSADSDIQLAAPAGDSAIELPTPAVDDELLLDEPKQDSDLNLDAAITGDDTGGGSDVLTGGSGLSPMFDDLDALDLDMPSAADSGISSNILEPGKGTPLPGGSALALEADLDAISLDPEPEAPKAGGSRLVLGDDELALGEGPELELEGSKAGGSAIDLTEDIDDELVLGGSSHGDISRTGDSGISLLDPADSGLSLESPPLELGGSRVESLELGEDDMLGIEEPAAAAGGEDQSDDDFLLTPLEEASAEESDSGSQVIALEGDVDFGEAIEGAGDELEDAGAAVGMLEEEDLGEGLAGVADLGSAAMAPTSGQLAAAGAGAGAFAMPEPAFSGWNVASLVMCSVLLMFTGMFMYDMLRNMWSWNGPFTVNSALMDMILSWFE